MGRDRHAHAPGGRSLCLQAALESKGEPIWQWDAGSVAGLARGGGIDQNKAPVCHVDGYPLCKIDLLRPPTAQHRHAHDQVASPNALNIFGAAAVFDYALRAYTRAVDRGDLAQLYGSFDRTNRGAAGDNHRKAGHHHGPRARGAVSHRIRRLCGLSTLVLLYHRAFDSGSILFDGVQSRHGGPSLPSRMTSCSKLLQDTRRLQECPKTGGG